ncbi:MAG TPA: hypothetical protein VL494_13705 [Steroidobacteraceae bacterium]|jgi:hypothetical protein|nr:hypothetical protein [Steroidobacteraceae bacterium]
MTVAQQDYAVPKLFINGAPAIQVDSIGFVTESGVQPVHLLGAGIGGFTIGSGQCTIEVGIKIPIGGQEHPYQQMCANGEDVELQLFFGRDSYNGVGKFGNVNLNGAVDQAASGTINWTGPKKPMES